MIGKNAPVAWTMQPLTLPDGPFDLNPGRTMHPFHAAPRSGDQDQEAGDWPCKAFARFLSIHRIALLHNKKEGPGMFGIRKSHAAASALLCAALFVTALPVSAANRSLDERLEEARVLLETRGSTLGAAQIEAISSAVGEALETSHFGLQTSALRLVITYAEDIAFARTTVFDVVRLYRDHKDDRVRRMAVVALGELNDAWGTDLLKRSLRFEKSAPVKHTIAAVLAEAKV